MNDSPLRIPPQITGIEPAAAPKPATPKPQEGVFEGKLIEAMGKVSQDVEKIESSAPANLDDVQSAMDAAKDAFSGTMHMHQMMQSLIQNDAANADGEGKTNG
ncbi:MAG: hypothetical protein P9L94_15715 [Candidatus Hinthialibacter antarcticus]|nr:hypothetical protein [Candidatus Hinthialibacter antarcticus]